MTHGTAYRQCDLFKFRRIDLRLFQGFSLIALSYGRAMDQAVSRRPFTAEARVRSQINVGFVVDKVTLGQVFPRVHRFTAVNFIPPVLHDKEKKTDHLYRHHRVAQ
jgi:hypothetical protein